MATTTADVEALRTAMVAAGARKEAADLAWQQAKREADTARREHDAASKAYEAARYQREFDRTHPGLFGDGDQGTTGRHTPDPDPEQSAFDVCLRCGRAIREAPELGAWVTTVSRNPECYGRTDYPPEGW